MLGKLSNLKYHPFPVQAILKQSVVLTFSLLKVELEGLIPEGLKLDLYQNQYAFLTVAVVDTRELRPASFPKLFGKNFHLIGYRIFVRFQPEEGKEKRGLYILQSETNKKSMQFLGGLFTQYNYQYQDLKFLSTNSETQIVSRNSELCIRYQIPNAECPLPKSSVFTNWSEARKFAGPMPYTFSSIEQQKKMLCVEGRRNYWQPKPLEIVDYNIPFFDSFAFRNLQLANAFYLENVPYYWKKGKLESWSN